jgi:aspartyl-tRNA(Asn)/glutamyl-tRNA(Gln) amidotransferase subunit A
MKTITSTITNEELPAVNDIQEQLAKDSFNSFHEIWYDSISINTNSIQNNAPLSGATIAIKDNIATIQGTTTCGSKMLEGYKSPFNATVIQRLVDAGAILVGKTNCDEFAMGSSSEHCAWGPVLNPWDTNRVPGGSSGGSAAAVAARLCQAALGSDTGGSVRQPASFCGIVGYKPTYGTVSRYGLVAFASSLDQIGVFSLTVEDAARITQVIGGYDELDSTSTPETLLDVVENLHTPVNNLRIGVPSQYVGDQNEAAVNEAIQSAIETFKKLGATIVDIELPLTDVGVSTYYVLAPAECSSNLARYDGIRYGHRTTTACADLFELYSRSRAEGFGAEVKRRIMLGTYVLSSGYYDAYYNNALKVRRLICEEYRRAFSECDVILGPTTPTPAFELGEKVDPISMYVNDVYTAPTNIAGICGISIPCGFSNQGGSTLPIGLHLQAAWHHDSTLLRTAQMFESATQFHQVTPEGCS